MLMPPADPARTPDPCCRRLPIPHARPIPIPPLSCPVDLVDSFLMAKESNKAANDSVPDSSTDTGVHIFYVGHPEGEEQEAFHIGTLSSVVRRFGLLSFF
ncbi:hypothetical protein KSP40_PGU013959 [Platanthera guangdongensis]|uniref:Uncharacterized protein n=1 Tax=Platanthera guangdongensis TaxID=2320717 RepID=A0ABR2M393_9ASPA